jgi:hypothetical protein
VIPRRGAAGHLCVNERVVVLEPILGEKPRCDVREERRARGDPERGQTVLHPFEVLGQPVGTTLAETDHLVDRVRE